MFLYVLCFYSSFTDYFPPFSTRVTVKMHRQQTTLSVVTSILQETEEFRMRYMTVLSNLNSYSVYSRMAISGSSPDLMTWSFHQDIELDLLKLSLHWLSMMLFLNLLLFQGWNFRETIITFHAHISALMWREARWWRLLLCSQRNIKMWWVMIRKRKIWLKNCNLMWRTSQLHTNTPGK